MKKDDDDDDDVGLHVLGCRVDILGTNCKKLLKVKMSGGGGGGGGVALASVRVIMSGGQQAYCCIKNTFCRWECILLRIKKRRPPAHSCKWACNEGSIH